jgi:gag-polyprotein putative aspartyl protease
MIRYAFNTQKQPPAPFVRVTLRHPRTGAEARDVPAQLDTGADCTLVPSAVTERLGLDFMGSLEIGGVGGATEEMTLYAVSLTVHNLPPLTISVVAHSGEPWVLLGRDVLNAYRLLLDGPNLALEIG